MKTNRLVFGLWALLSVVVFQLPAQQSEADRKLLADIRAKAEMGDAQCQGALGQLLFLGDGVAKDATEAVKWYRKAAEQNHAKAQYYLAYCSETGQGVAKDEAEALKWYRKAAEQNYADAQHDLGVCYANGELGVMEDVTEAVRWYRKAAEQNHAKAQYELGTCYFRGQGVAQDDEQAVKWFRKAADQNDPYAQFALGICYANGRGVAKDYQAAAKWFRKSADQGNVMAQTNLGGIYATGEGVVKDYVEAYKWRLLAAAQNDELAKKAVSALEGLMTRDQIAEGQRLAGNFKLQQASPTGIDASRTDNPQPRTESSGTGFFLTEDGFLITNNHVVEGSSRVLLVTSAGLIPAKVVKMDAANDLALLKADGRFAALPVVASRGVKLGGTVATVGFPNIGLQGFAPKLAKGEVASLSGAGDDARYFQISVPVQPGNSGGALVDERGNVVGVVSAKLNASAALLSSGALPENVNYAVKSSYLLSFLESVPEVSAKLKEPETKERKFEDVVKSAEQAAVLVLVY